MLMLFVPNSNSDPRRVEAIDGSCVWALVVLVMGEEIWIWGFGFEFLGVGGV